MTDAETGTGISVPVAVGNALLGGASKAREVSTALKKTAVVPGHPRMICLRGSASVENVWSWSAVMQLGSGKIARFEE